VDRDFRQLVRRFGSPKGGARYKKLNIFFLECEGVQVANRLTFLMSLIEHEWSVAGQKAARTMWLEIGLHHVRSNR
jgi:hypothetical protein